MDGELECLAKPTTARAECICMAAVLVEREANLRKEPQVEWV